MPKKQPNGLVVDNRMAMNHRRSQELFEEAQRYLPGGVDSPVRAFKSVRGSPLFVTSGRGSKICDADGNKYIDYVCSWGPLILGHSHPHLIKALEKALQRGTSFGAPTVLETSLAKMISDAMPSIEMIRFVNSGTESVMSALRLARAFTGRDKVVKFAGCYHGHSDGLLVNSGSGLATLGISESPGVPVNYAQNTLVARYNDIESVKQLFHSYPKDIAAIIIEPVAANMGVVLPRPGFLKGLRNSCDEFGALLIFDEVITGFRVNYGGAQKLYNISPDLTCLGKIIGGGLPVGAYGGKKEIMAMVAPLGKVYQAGTLSGNPLVMTAGIETLKLLAKSDTYIELEIRAANLEKGIICAAQIAAIDVQVIRIASLLTIFFTDSTIADYESAKKSDTIEFTDFFQKLLGHGIYWPPSQFESAFVSLAHSDHDIQITVKAITNVFKSMGK
jgi:glutamate-1-semialdehyde 2,1-aminomutase